MKIELTTEEYSPFMGIMYKSIKAIASANGSEEEITLTEMLNAIEESKAISISIDSDSTEDKEDKYIISLNEKMISSMYGITDKYLPIFISQITAIVITAKQYTGEMDTEMKSIMDFLDHGLLRRREAQSRIKD